MATQLIDLQHVYDNPYQPRITDDAEHIEKLARSIAADDLLQKPTARQFNGGFQLAFGHSRRKAFEWLRNNWKKAGLPERYSGYTNMPMEVAELTDEEMYRNAVSENVQRKDLAPTEVARSIKRYMDEFGANSKTAAELFGMNDATVRGMVRLLDLPDAVQQKLDDGTITQGTARMFHSLQKVASEAVIISTLKDIEKGEELPEVVIHETVDNLDNVVDMWNDHHRDGKPRAGYHGWLLDWKNFPNKLLPELTKEEAALSAEKREHLVNPPTCTTCPFYTKIRGSHYCGVKACYQRKTAAWFIHAVQEASQQTGIAIYAETDGGYRTLDSNDKQLFEKRHKDLRLIHGCAYQNFKGLDDDLVLVVATGEALTKMRHISSATPKGGKKTEKEKAEMRAMKIYRAHRPELFWAYTAVAKSMFDAVPMYTLNKLNNWHNIGIDDRIPEEYSKGNSTPDAKADYQRRALVWRLIMNCGSHDQRKQMVSILADMQEVIGVKPPKALIKQAEQWDAEINAVAKGVAVETAKGSK